MDSNFQNRKLSAGISATRIQFRRNLTSQRCFNDHFLFLSDSLSCLQSMGNRDMSHPLIAGTHKILLTDARLVFMWIPSHVALAGNSAADTAAKAALLVPVSNVTLPYSDYFPLIRTHVLNQWQASWSLETQFVNKLHATEPMVNTTKSYRLPHREERIIDYELTRGHLLKESPPQCSACQTQLTV
jgi:hypothetical protein